jgi:hypothetical protein
VALRRFIRIREQRAGLVAIYDSLLFLMVAILIAEGMFLYSATTVNDGGGFSSDTYQRLCDNQLIMVEELVVNETHPMPMVAWSNSSNSFTIPISNVTIPGDAETVHWMLQSYCDLTWENDNPLNQSGGQWDVDSILQFANSMFEGTRLNGTEYAWEFLYEGGEVFFTSSMGGTITDLPKDRWASSRDYSFTSGTIDYSAELRYFLWFP